MPRIRTIKPEFWTNGRVLECSPNSRLLFIGLWNFCDDAGRHPMRPKQIKAQIFPADDFSSESILGMIEELEANGLLSLYSVGSDTFIQVNGWDHQRIDKPQKPRYPDPEEMDSENIPGTFPPDRKGKEGIGKEGKGAKRASAPAPADADDAAQPGTKGVKRSVRRPEWADPQIWEDWKRTRKAKLTPTAWTPIENQINAGIEAGHDPNDMLRAATERGWTGLKLDWYENHLRGGRQSNPSESPSERAAREAREYRQRKQAGVA